MRQKLLFPLISILLCFPAFSFAQKWSGIIAPSRAADWSQAGIAGGIPNRTTVCSTLNPGASAAQISTAISSCPSGQVVFLNAGTYNLSGGIDFGGASNVTLRGAGPDQTSLVFSNNTNCNGMGGDVCVAGSNNYSGGPEHSANWTAGYARGTTQITLSSTSGIVAGATVLILDQQDDSSDGGGVYVCQTGNTCAQEGPSGSGRPGRAQEQMVRVTAVSGNTVTISPGLYMPNWRSSQGPGAWWANTTIKADGVENISLDHTNSPDTPTSGIFFFGCDGCWVKNVRSLNAGRNHVWLYETDHTVVRDSYFYGTKNAASQSYGIETFMSSDNLVENNIFQHITTSIQGNGSASGTVFGYNYSVDDFYNVSPNWMQPANELHAAGTDMILFEGNVGAAFETDDVHGTHNFTTLFRNYYLGWETGKAAQTIPVQLYAWSRYFNVIGNVLGKPGYHTQYQSIPSASTNANSAIFVLGWANNEGTSGSAGPDDSLTASTLMRWGNYDTANNAVRWNASETASTLSQYASLVPSSQILPPSFYLSSKPAFWGSMPWPAIGPDVTGGSDPSGHAYANPAQACYNSTAAASGILTFNATKCYTGGSSTTSAAPAPPTNLTATPN